MLPETTQQLVKGPNNQRRGQITHPICDGLYTDLLTLVKQWKLHWCGYITRCTLALAKPFYKAQCRVDKEEASKDWTGIEVRETLTREESWMEWKKLVAIT
ncbi:hypothetical protein PoB_001668100 [Plakobranchus ocellatus]|uniref:Uncharacterized protein n=1 Tax=Plakobranchus ocellatus TaxID=259542 RepID=A0AAV3Z6E9_9GAST|nr:hypothetical protein PoB_001668100 [Plakobranchus ocellatus]